MTEVMREENERPIEQRGKGCFWRCLVLVTSVVPIKDPNVSPHVISRNAPDRGPRCRNFSLVRGEQHTTGEQEGAGTQKEAGQPNHIMVMTSPGPRGL
jgi:hypothetical protein